MSMLGDKLGHRPQMHYFQLVFQCKSETFLGQKYENESLLAFNATPLDGGGSVFCNITVLPRVPHI